MNTDHIIPWEEYPKFLQHHEIVNPLLVIKDFFTADFPKEHFKRLKDWRRFVIRDKVFAHKHDGPGALLFTYELNIKLIEAAYLLHLKSKDESTSKTPVPLEQLKEEKRTWLYFPKNLSKKQLCDPYCFLRNTFKHITLQRYRRYLQEWLYAAFDKHSANESLETKEIIEVFENLQKLYSAAWLIHQREAGCAMFKIKSNAHTQEADEPELPEVSLRQIKPQPTPAEKLALTEIQKLILLRFPMVEAIIHLGTQGENETFFLLLLISDNEKTVENGIINKIEDNLRYLAGTHIFLHKTSSAMTGLKTGRRFWKTVLENGNQIYTAPNICFPKSKTITNEELIKRAHFHWNRWGKQGLAFLKGAECYKKAGNNELAAFLMHQSCESTLKGIIQTVTGYRVNIHNLSRILKISLLFTDDLDAVFRTEQAQTLMPILQNAYTDARYKNTYTIEAEIAEKLLLYARKVHLTAEALFRKHISSQTPSA